MAVFVPVPRQANFLPERLVVLTPIPRRASFVPLTVPLTDD